MFVYKVEAQSFDNVLLEEALYWLRNFYPDIKVYRDQSVLEIRSQTRTPEQLAAAFMATLSTEIGHRANAAQRKALLRELIS